MGFYTYKQKAGFDASTAVSNDFVHGVTVGQRTARGVVTLDGTNPTPVATGLAAVVGASATLIGTALTTGDPSFITVNFTTSTGNLDIHAWKFTGTGATTLIASTSSGYTVSWVASGV